MVEPRKASFGLTFLSGALVFCAFVVIVSLWFRAMPAKESHNDRRAADRVRNLGNLRVAESQKLNNYAWADKEKGLAQIPIARAMALTLAELQARQVQPSAVAVENPYPGGLQPIAAAPAPEQAAATPAPASAAPAPTPNKEAGQ
jgi:predicted outer membrane lipoprotein